MHQRTINAMKKRTPAIQRAIKNYNALCQQLRDLLPRGSRFPLPEELGTDLKHLRNNDALMRDVYIAAGDDAPPQWLTDVNIRKGIRAIQTQDRCAEEQVRLTREWRNLCAWHDGEKRAVAAAAANPDSELTNLRAPESLRGRGRRFASAPLGA